MKKLVLIAIMLMIILFRIAIPTMAAESSVVFGVVKTINLGFYGPLSLLSI